MNNATVISQDPVKNKTNNEASKCYFVRWPTKKLDFSQYYLHHPCHTSRKNTTANQLGSW